MTFDIGKIRDDEIERIIAMDRDAFARGSDAAGVDIREETERTWSMVWVAREDAEPVGYLVAWHVADELHLLMIGTAHAARRRGVARALMSRLLAFSAADNVMHIFLEVRPSNVGAIALYRECGFYVLSLRKKYYADGEDGLEMALALDPITRQVVRREDEPL